MKNIEMKNIEKILNLLSDMNTIDKADELSQSVGLDLCDELSENELEMVSAAGTSNYSKFVALLREKGIN